MRKVMTTVGVVLVLLSLTVGGCARRQPPIAKPVPPVVPPVTAGDPAPSSTPTTEALPVPPEPVALAPDEGISGRSIEDLNRDSPFKPAFFALDSAELDDAGRAVVTANAGLMRKYPTWMITVEGHCDERGTAEYNLALGERRAVAVKSYLMTLGIPADRVRTVSYGKEFPFDPGHDERAWASNRRAHFVITSK